MLRRLFVPFLALMGLALPCAAPAAVPQLSLPQLDKLEEALELTPEQKDQYETAVASTKRMLFHVALVGMQLKEKLRDELAKPLPDFGVLKELRNAIEEGRPLRREARDEWMKLYRMLDAEQVRTLRRFIEEQLDHVGVLHEFMMQLVLPPPPRERL
jgi:hypothetical protein